MSVPFTWNLPDVLKYLELHRGKWRVGGPAVRLMPAFLSGLPHVTVDTGDLNVLWRVNQDATRTTVGCPNRCKFCAVPRTSGPFREFDAWRPAPLVTDDNLLASSEAHFDKVILSLINVEGVDFNQGLDARLMTGRHADGLRKLKGAMIRLSFDSWEEEKHVARAVSLLRLCGITKAKIRVYVLIGWKYSPRDDWERCKAIEGYGVKPLPMWFHELDALKANTVTNKQRELGWDDHERREIMQWFYKHKIASPGN